MSAASDVSSRWRRTSLELVGSPYGRHAEHYRQPHREDLRGPDRGGRHPRHRPQENHHRRRRPGPVHLRPGVHEHRRLQEQDHLHRRRQGHPDVPRIPDRAAGRVQHLPRDGVPDPVRRAAHQGRSSTTWTHAITMHTMVHENIKKFMEGFTYDAHPMGVFISTVGAMSTFYPDGKQIFNAESRLKQIHRLIAKTPTIAAFAYRHSIGRPYVYPDNDLSFTGNFLNMLFKMTEVKYQPNAEARARARRAVHPARRSRAELLDQLDARDRQLARRSVLGAGRRRRRALRPAARRRQRSGAAHAEGDRQRARTSPPSSRRSRPAKAA